MLRAVPDTPSDYEVREDDRVVDVVPVPTDGPVLFVLQLPHGDDSDAAAHGVKEVQAAAGLLAPGRHQVLALCGGITLDVLGDDDLAQVGLQRIPDGAGR